MPDAGKTPVASRLPAALVRELAIWGREDLNPKVANLVVALWRAGFRTTMSGDFYADDLVYVDLQPPGARAAAEATLPLGWRLTFQHVAITRRDVLGTPIPEAQLGVTQTFMDFVLPVRLARAGRHVTESEAHKIVSALNEIVHGGFHADERDR